MRVDPHEWLSDGLAWALVAVVALTLSLLLSGCARDRTDWGSLAQGVGHVEGTR